MKKWGKACISSLRGEWIQSSPQISGELVFTSSMVTHIRANMFHDEQQSGKSEAWIQMERMVEILNSEPKLSKGQCWAVNYNTYSEQLWLWTRTVCIYYIVSLWSACVHRHEFKRTHKSAAAVIPVLGRLRQDDYIQFMYNLGYIIAIS